MIKVQDVSACCVLPSGVCRARRLPAPRSPLTIVRDSIPEHSVQTNTRTRATPSPALLPASLFSVASADIFTRLFVYWQTQGLARQRCLTEICWVKERDGALQQHPSGKGAHLLASHTVDILRKLFTLLTK